MPGNEKDDANTLRILLATDIHLGYGERDAIKGNDSLVSFEEILENAQKHNVDFVLLGGDLFHDNKPSRRIMHGCLSLLRKYCLGDKPVQFEFQSDQSVNFEHCQFPTLNYEDPNFNISIPVFSIHGNHDDPTGPGNLCSLDLIHSAGLINYFGKTTSLEKITVSPLLMEKGSTKFALYGLGSIRDERLHRLFLKKNVAMLRPRENQDDWFNMFVIHQNRAKHSDTNYIPEQFLDDFLDLVMWGHEHECRIIPEFNGIQNFYITQPGSSVATSLSEGETKQKHIGLLKIRGKDFKVTPIALQTVRQFYLEDIVLSDTSLNPNDPNVGKKVEAFCQEKVERLLEKAESEHTGNKKQPKEPMVRLRIDYTGFETFSIYRFGRYFMNRVANPEQMIIFHQKRKMGLQSEGSIDDLELLASLHPQSLDSARVEDMVKDYFNKVDTANQLQVLTEKGMSEAVKEYVDKEEREAISELVKYQLQKTQKYLKVRNTDESAIDTEVVRFKDERRKKHEDDQEDVQVAIKRAQSLRDSNPDPDSRMNSDTDEEPSTSAPTRGRGRGQGREGGSRGSKTFGDFGDDTAKDTPPKRGRGSRAGVRGRGKAPVVMGTGSRSVKDMLLAGSQRQASKRKNVKAAAYTVDDSDEEGSVNISDEDGDMFNIPSSRQKQAQAQKSSSRTKAPTQKRSRKVVLESDDDDDTEEDYMPGKRRR